MKKYWEFIKENKLSPIDLGRVKELCEEYELQNYTINPDGTVDINGDVDIRDQDINEYIPIKFGTVTGNFDCSHNQLKSLKNCPVEVKGSFYCSWNAMTDLQGSPKRVGNHFCCDQNEYLESLYGCPTDIYGDFDCEECNLSTLETGPRSVKGSYTCNNNFIYSLKGAPNEVGGDFNCSNNDLADLEFSPERVGGDFICYGNEGLTTLEGSPKSVGKDFNCGTTEVSSFEFGPERVGGDFNVGVTKIRTFDGFPDYFGEKATVELNGTPLYDLMQYFGTHYVEGWVIQLMKDDLPIDHNTMEISYTMMEEVWDQMEEKQGHIRRYKYDDIEFKYYKLVY